MRGPERRVSVLTICVHYFNRQICMCENTCEARGFHLDQHIAYTTLFCSTQPPPTRSYVSTILVLRPLFSLVSGAGVRTHTRADHVDVHVHDLTHRDGNWDSREKNLVLQTDIYSSY